MEYTKNYHLPQWVKEDRIMMEDFNAAMSSIESGIGRAQSSADEAAKLPYVVGTYTGTGANLEIKVGFRPSFLIIGGMKAASAPSDFLSTAAYNCFFGGHQELSYRIELTDTGFRVYDTAGVPQLSKAGHTYDYIAFR